MPFADEQTTSMDQVNQYNAKMDGMCSCALRRQKAAQPLNSGPSVTQRALGFTPSLP